MSPDDALAHATEIGERLLAEQRSDESRLPWAYRLGQETDDGEGFIRAVGDSMYLGTAGIVHFLVALHAATGEKRYLQAAERAGEGMIRRYETLGPASPGLYIGQAGPALALLELSRATGDDRYRGAAEEQAGWIAQQPAVWSDLMNGPPGYGLLFLALHEATGDERWLDAARRCVTALQETAEPFGEEGSIWPCRLEGEWRWVNPGLAHGTAGTAVFLHTMARIGPPSGAGEIGQKADAVLRQTADAREGGLDWRHSIEPDGGKFLVQWCHGAPGVGVAWLYSPAADAVEIAQAAGRVTWAAGDNRAQASQCHGVCGNAETFIELYRHTRDQEWLERADRFAELALGHRLTDKGPGAFRTHDSDDLTYDLMTGVAGVGYFFLRFARPHDIPYPVIGRWLERDDPPTPPM